MRPNTLTRLVLVIGVFIFAACTKQSEELTGKEKAVGHALDFKESGNKADLDAAVEAQRELYERDPTSVSEASDLAVLLAARGERKRANELLTSSKKHARNFGDWVMLGSGFVGLGEIDEARLAYDHAVTLAGTKEDAATLKRFADEIKAR